MSSVARRDSKTVERGQAKTAARPLDCNDGRLSMTLPTDDVVFVGDTISACVRRKGGRQMYWYAARIVEFEGDRALVELDRHPGERALLGARNLRRRTVTSSACGEPGHD